LGRSSAPALPGWARLAPTSDGQPRLNFQPVPEPKMGKSRIHLDVTVADIERGMQQVADLGGRWLGERHDYDEGVVVVMADPEGNEFCLVQYYG
jgi:predicted enzyme related to lactoylglutathione lyase